MSLLIMNRLLRWTFSGAALVSALACTAVCVLWARSYRHGLRISDNACWTATGEVVAVDWSPKVPIVGYSQWEIDWLAGCVAWHSQVFRSNFRDNPSDSIRPPPEDAGFKVWEYPKVSAEIEEDAKTIGDEERKILDNRGWIRGGFGYSRNRTYQFLDTDAKGSEIERRALVPDWSLMVAFLLVPGCWILRRLVTMRRRTVGFSVSGGDYLRSSTEQSIRRLDARHA